MLPAKIEQYTISNIDNKYVEMLSDIGKSLENISISAESFYKTSSQLKSVTLDVNDLTPIGAAKHIIAVIERTKNALKESEISIRRAEIDEKRALRKIENSIDELDKQEAEIELLEIRNKIKETRLYQQGAIKKLSQFTEEYNEICRYLEVEYITEEMYEENEARHHIIRCMSQAMAAARARGGLIDEGNFIYLQDLGLNGAAAQRELIAYFEMEQDIINKGQVPTFDMQMSWLNAFADKYCGEIHRWVKSKGLVPIVEKALSNNIKAINGGKNGNKSLPS